MFRSLSSGLIFSFNLNSVDKSFCIKFRKVLSLLFGFSYYQTLLTSSVIFELLLWCVLFFFVVLAPLTSNRCVWLTIKLYTFNSLSSAQSINPGNIRFLWKNLGTPRIEPGTAGWETRSLSTVLCSPRCFSLLLPKLRDSFTKNLEVCIRILVFWYHGPFGFLVKGPSCFILNHINSASCQSEDWLRSIKIG